jgi:hypothetical protein
VSEIIIKLHHRFKDEQGLVKRIARIVRWDDSGVYQQTSGYKWTLDVQANDWWCSGIEDGGDGKPEIKIAYRYGGGGNQPMMDSLKVLLDWILGPH